MKFRPKIKILILNWNGVDDLDSCLESIQKIKYDNFTTTVIDNGSKDNSCDMIEKKYSKVDIIRIDKNLGYSKGYNYAFNMLKKDNFKYYLILNNDTVVDEFILDNFIKNSNFYGEENIYSAKINFMDSDIIWYAGGKVCKFLGLTYHKFIYKIENLQKYKTSKTDYVSGCCMFVSKDLINKLKGFKEEYKMYYEDVDLCLRAKQFNSNCYIIEESTIFHKVSGSIGNNSLNKTIMKMQSQIKFMFINNNLFIFVLGLLINMLLLPIYLIKFIYEKF